MTDLSKLLSELSPEQRELLQLRLKKQQQASLPGGRIRRRDPGREELPLSFGQQRLWLLDQWDPGNPAYNMFGAYRFEGPLDVPVLAASFREIVRRHEALRTSIVATGGKPRQVVSPPSPVSLPLVDLSGLEAPRVQEEARRVSLLYGFQRFDLARGPLLRLGLLRIADADHWMLVSFHHIVVDGWSVGVFNRELFTTYAALQRGVPPPLPPLPVQYPDYAIWQRDWMQGEVLEAQLEFWKKLLAGAPSRLDLPFDHPRSAAQGAPSGDIGRALGKDLADRLRALALAEGGTLFMVLLTGFSLLLSRHAGVDDVVVGSPVANRNRSEIEGLIGFFVNTLAFRIDLRGNPTVRELLAQARKVVSDAYDHQDMPFELVIDALELERDASHPPLVQVALSLQNLPAAATQLAGLRMERIPLRSAVAKFELLAGMSEEPHGLQCNFEYNRGLFEPDTVSRLAGHFATVLQSLPGHLDQRISELPLLSASERQQLIVDWNQTASAFPRDRTVGELFEEQAAKTPDNVAVVFRDQSLTYAELNAEADRLARHLRRLGVGPEVPVGLCADRSLDLIVGLLAIVKAGGAFVPLDPAYPSERLGYMLESSGAPLVLAQTGTLPSLPETSAKVLLLEELRAEALDVSEPSVSRPVSENLLYIMYTSGSTGRPKGVAITHRSAIRLVREAGYAHLGPDETFLQLVPLSFDPSMFEIWGALLHGARLVLFPNRVPLPEDLEETIRNQGVTTLWLTTGLFHQVVDYRIEILRPLRQLLAGGEALSLPHVRRILETFPHLRLVNGYGPTEVTCFTTCWQAHPLPEDAPVVPIGKPIANTRVLVLDPHGQPVPVGVHGELYAGGEGVARCYFGRPDLTAERFVPDPFPPAGEAGARLYRTGDRVRYRPDGTIDFFGRFDNQVKVRGFRIELGEIEAAIGRHPRVSETIVLVREDTPGHRRIVAYVVPDAPEAVTSASAGDLKAFVAETLPEYMVPAAWVLLESLPLTPNGKVDRRALPAPGVEREEGAEWIAPRNETEARIAEIWAEILGVERVGVEDDFFKLGGHSLLATQLMSRIRDTFEIEVSFARFFKAPTVAGVAAAIVEQRAEQVDESDLLAMLAELKGLSAEELQAQLAVEGQPVLEDDFA